MPKHETTPFTFSQIVKKVIAILLFLLAFIVIFKIIYYLQLKFLKLIVIKLDIEFIILYLGQM